jgi:phage baseplate assembly protein W
MIIIYSDVNETNPKSDPVLKNVKSVDQALDNLIFTDPGERFFRPEIGVGIDDIIFEYIDLETNISLFVLTSARIKRFEPRVRPKFAGSKFTNIDNNIFGFTIKNEIQGLGGELFEKKGTFTK